MVLEWGLPALVYELQGRTQERFLEGTLAPLHSPFRDLAWRCNATLLTVPGTGPFAGATCA